MTAVVDAAHHAGLACKVVCVVPIDCVKGISPGPRILPSLPHQEPCLLELFAVTSFLHNAFTYIVCIRTRSPRSRCFIACRINSGCGTKISKTLQAASRGRLISGEWIISGMLMQCWRSQRSKAPALRIFLRTSYPSCALPCIEMMSLSRSPSG